MCIFSYSNISSWYQSGTIPFCTSVSVYHRRHCTYLQQYPDLGRLFQRIPTPEVSKSKTLTRATSPHIILKRVHPMHPSLVNGTSMRHLGFGHRPLPTLFQPSDRHFGVVWIVDLYTSILLPIFVSSGFVLRVY